jgi:hypothetical protein
MRRASSSATARMYSVSREAIGIGPLVKANDPKARSKCDALSE